MSSDTDDQEIVLSFSELTDQTSAVVTSLTDERRELATDTSTAGEVPTGSSATLVTRSLSSSASQTASRTSEEHYTSSSFESESEDDDVYSSSFVSSEADSEEECEAVESFCKRKIDVVRKPVQATKIVGKRRRGRIEWLELNEFCSKKIDVVTSVSRREGVRPAHYPSVLDGRERLPVNRRVVERLKALNIVQNMHQANQTEFHEPKKCKCCRKKMAICARQKFLREKKSLLDKHNTEQKVEHQLWTVDSLTMVGDILKTLPKLQDKPDKVWSQLMQPLSRTTQPAT